MKIPAGVNDTEITFPSRTVNLTNLDKPFWTKPLITKRDLLQYYADVADVLLPHLRDRAMLMKRYPNGAAGEFFFMKRAPASRPQWICTCSIPHASGSVIDFPVVDDLPSLVDDRGKLLTDLPLNERRPRLEAFARKFLAGRIELSPATASITAAKKWLRGGGGSLDGVVAKRIDLPYQTGERTGMVKIKNLRTADCVIGGFRYAEKGWLGHYCSDSTIMKGC